MNTPVRTRALKTRHAGVAALATLTIVAGGALTTVQTTPADAAGLGSAGSGSAKKPHKKKAHKKKSTKKGKSGTCKASYYGSGYRTASGERFRPNKLTAAHKTFKFGTKVKVTNKKNGRSVTVRINDRGPFVKSRCLDVSTGAMKKIKGTKSGVVKVKWSVVSTPKKK